MVKNISCVSCAAYNVFPINTLPRTMYNLNVHYGFLVKEVLQFEIHPFFSPMCKSLRAHL